MVKSFRVEHKKVYTTYYSNCVYMGRVAFFSFLFQVHSSCVQLCLMFIYIFAFKTWKILLHIYYDIYALKHLSFSFYTFYYNTLCLSTLTSSKFILYCFFVSEDYQDFWYYIFFFDFFLCLGSYLLNIID